MTPDDVSDSLAAQGYLPDDGIATAVFLATTLQRPLLLEGEAGVGKTELAKALAASTGGELIRLQCYEGIDVAQAVYDWDYARQLLHLRATEASGEAQQRSADELEAELYVKAEEMQAKYGTQLNVEKIRSEMAINREVMKAQADLIKDATREN